MDSEEQKTQEPKSSNNLWLILLLVVVLVLVGLGFLYYRKTHMNMGAVPSTNMPPMPGINNRMVSAGPAPQNMSAVKI
jgi:flagellar basal body-associated protein FliL